MKKVLCLIMAITVMCTGLCGCGRMSDAEVTDNTVDGVIGGTSEYDTAKRGVIGATGANRSAGANRTGGSVSDSGKTASGSTKTDSRTATGYVISPIKGNTSPMDGSMSGKFNTAR